MPREIIQTYPVSVTTLCEEAIEAEDLSRFTVDQNKITDEVIEYTLGSAEETVKLFTDIDELISPYWECLGF